MGDTHFWHAIPIEKRVAIALWRLLTSNSSRTVAKTFAVRKSTAVQITREFWVMLRLALQYIHFPKSRRETTEATKQLKVFCQCRMPEVIGVLEGTHIAIVLPNNDRNADYVSRKRRYTIFTQVVVGANLVFLDVATRFPGSCHNACNFRNTSLYTQAVNEEIQTKSEDVIKKFTS